jgi:hypothetical protein
MNKIIHFLTTWLSRSGDTSFWSWVITILYVITISLSIYYIQKIKADKTQHFLWICISIFLIAMGINKQLDIQTLQIMSGSSVARRIGSWKFKYIIQTIVVLVVFLSAFITSIFVLSKTRSILRQSLLTISGVLLLIFFTLIRVASISHFRIYVPHVHSLEFLGLFIILISQINNKRKIPQKT